jgi:hypothetical protein
VTAGRRAVTGGLGFAYVLSTLAGALLVAISVAGLLHGDRGLYDPDPATLPAFYAQDAVTLALAFPLLATSMWLARRGSVRGLLLWSGALAYVVYWYYFYVVGARFNPLFLAYVAAESLSLFALLALLARLDAAAIRDRFDAGAPVRAVGAFLIATASLFVVLWTSDVVRRLRAGAPLDDVSRTVYAIDLTVMLPALAIGGVLAWRHRPWGYVLAGLLLVKAASTGIMLLAGTAMQARLGVAVDPAPVAGYALVAAGGLALTALFLRAVRREPSRPRSPGATAGRRT